MRFSEMLLVMTVFTGIVWALDAIFLRPRRRMYVFSDSKNLVEPWWVEYSKSFFPILLVVFLLRTFLVEPFRIPSGSMHPTLLEGDFILVNKYEYGIGLPFLGKVFSGSHPERGDVIVFKHDTPEASMDMIKRVVGLPNDRIRYQDKILYINDEPVKQEFLGEKLDYTAAGMGIETRIFEETLGLKKHPIYIYPSVTNLVTQYPFSEVVVPPNAYFVMGDNRDNSKDSRVWGFVPEKDIQGKAFSIWMSVNTLKPLWENWDNFKQFIRWDRIATTIE